MCEEVMRIGCVVSLSQPSGAGGEGRSTAPSARQPSPPVSGITIPRRKSKSTGVLGSGVVVHPDSIGEDVDVYHLNPPGPGRGTRKDN